jgi:hypothetical protein
MPLTLLVRVPSTDFDFFVLKQSLTLLLRTDFMSGDLQKIVSATFAYQAAMSGSDYPLETCHLTLLTVLPGTSKIISITSSGPAPYPSVFVGVNLTDLLPPVSEGETTDDEPTHPTSSEYWDSHAWFALTVSGFTLAALLLCYLCFLLVRCRVKTISDRSSLLPSSVKPSTQPRKGYAKVNVGQREGDSSHNDDAVEASAEGEDDMERASALQSRTERAKRVGNKILRGVKEGFRRQRQHRDVEDGSGFVELEGVEDSEDEITLDLNEMVAKHRNESGQRAVVGKGLEADETY